MLALYNSLSRREEPLPDQPILRLFVCGPTVYDYLHLGNARTYVFFDLFAKLLRARGYEVHYLQNITDVDDKIIAKAAAEHRSAAEVAATFTEAYLDDMRALGVDAVTTYAPATAFISQIVAQVERLIDKGFAYEIPGDGWYFDIAKDPEYGKLSGRTAAQAEDGVSRIDESRDKRNKGDFCLWKFRTEGNDAEPSWPSSLGAGRPGWHIEDTAISEYYFGPQYEIHGGGLDLKFPHHEAELAQQESASGMKPFVRIWMHAGALTVEGRKMAKSAGNFVTIRDFLAKEGPRAAALLRWMAFSHHYRAPFDLSERVIAQAKKELETISARFLEIRDTEPGTVDPGWMARIDEALDDDLNTPKALSLFMEATKGDALAPGARLALFRFFDRLFGFAIESATALAREIPAEVLAKFEEYKVCRDNKQFIQSDALRKELEGLGYEIRDAEAGSVLVKRFF